MSKYITKQKLLHLGFKEEPVVEHKKFRYQVFMMRKGFNTLQVTNDLSESGKITHQYMEVNVDDHEFNPVERNLGHALALFSEIPDQDPDIIQQLDGTVDAIAQDLENEISNATVRDWDVIKGH